MGSLALVHFLASLVENRRDIGITVILPGEAGAEFCDTGCHRQVDKIAGSAGIEIMYTREIRLGSDEPYRLAVGSGITKFATKQCLDDAALVTLVAFIPGKTDNLWGNSWMGCTGNVPVITPFIQCLHPKLDFMLN